MIIRDRIASLFFFYFLSLIPALLAEAPTSFCKCTCFSNSTIIPLGPLKPHTPSAPTSEKRTIFGRTLFTPHDNSDAVAVTFRKDRSTSLDSREDENKDSGGKGDKKFRSANCNDCNRKFCMDLQLPMCKGAKEEDVQTACFQRESNKDKAVVLIFIIATVSLLAWAAVKPWADKWIQAARQRRLYTPLS